MYRALDDRGVQNRTGRLQIDDCELFSMSGLFEFDREQKDNGASVVCLSC